MFDVCACRNTEHYGTPDLLDAVRHRADDRGVEAALVRYMSRMSSRPTPYGMFAACGVGVIDERTEVTLPEPTAWRLHTQLDADYLDALIRDRCQRFRHRLTFRPNDSLHLMGGRWRYVESRLDGLERSYHLLQVADSRHLQRALEAARPTATLAEVTDAVATAGVGAERAARSLGRAHVRWPARPRLRWSCEPFPRLIRRGQRE